ncbi:MAG: xanthine dehydrogenase small subunit [Chromatiales bacterium]|nr:xanthine dehydrogenase small subunit [Chromatiales bacterium]
MRSHDVDSGVVRFVLDGQTIEIDNPPPTRTVLQWLREDVGRVGTKEGCAEGDCGACTVVVLSRSDGATKLDVQAVNACIQFLPTLDGKELLTVESLRAPDGQLHPIQQAMVDCHASQCGFCTPGFVMSLFALYKNSRGASHQTIADTLSGNLCRCTGYRPIVEAATKMYAPKSDAPTTDTHGAHSSSDWLTRFGSTDTGATDKLVRLTNLRRSSSLAVENPSGRFYSPRALGELAQLYFEKPQALLLAGGTDVGLWVTKLAKDLPSIIYLGEVAELRAIRVDANHLELGAGVTLTRAMEPLSQHFPQLTELLRRYASPPIRNVATLGGNIANASPIGDSMPALLALDAQLVLRLDDVTREVALDDFYTGYQQTQLRAGEFIQSIRVPLLGSHQHMAVYKVSKRFDQDISAVCVAFCVSLNNGVITHVRLAFGGVAAVPLRAKKAEQVMLGQPFGEECIHEAMGALRDSLTPLSDLRASSAYRMQVSCNLLWKLLLQFSGQLDVPANLGAGLEHS